MNADEFLASLDLTPLDPDAYENALWENRWEAAVETFARLDHAYRERGDLDATQAWYAFTYTTRVPGLNVLWSDAYVRCFQTDLERQVLPVLLETVRDGRTILVLGCGDGLETLFLALHLPNAQLVGVDLQTEGLTIARRRAAHLGLTNVTFREGNVFALPPGFLGPHDWVILRNVVDDTRRAGTEIIAGEFETAEKLRSILPFVDLAGHVWMSMTPFPVYDPAFELRITGETFDADFQSGPVRHIPYTMGTRACVHLVWMLRPITEKTLT